MRMPDGTSLTSATISYTDLINVPDVYWEIATPDSGIKYNGTIRPNALNTTTVYSQLIRNDGGDIHTDQVIFGDGTVLNTASGIGGGSSLLLCKVKYVSLGDLSTNNTWIIPQNQFNTSPLLQEGTVWTFGTSGIIIPPRPHHLLLGRQARQRCASRSNCPPCPARRQRSSPWRAAKWLVYASSGARTRRLDTRKRALLVFPREYIYTTG